MCSDQNQIAQSFSVLWLEIDGVQITGMVVIETLTLQYYVMQYTISYSYVVTFIQSRNLNCRSSNMCNGKIITIRINNNISN
jgi:hypothetical protein